MTATRRTWWGEYEIPVGQGGRIRVGATVIAFQHLGREWRVARERSRDARDRDDEEVEVEVPCEVDDLMSCDDTIRIGTGSAAPKLVIAPALADRAVVAHPEKPFSVAPRDAVTAYVSSPLWAQLSFEAGAPLIHELPIIRPSDTWFGPSARVGELCYASVSVMRLAVDQIAPSTVRAHTPVRIENRTDQPLVVTRIKLPVRYLALYRGEDGGVWTESIRVDNRGDAEPVPLEFGTWGEVAVTEPLAEPREPDRDNLVERALNLLSRHVG